MYFYGTNNTVKVYPVPIEITDALNAVGNSVQCSGTGGAFAELITVTSCPVPIRFTNVLLCGRKAYDVSWYWTGCYGTIN